MSVLQQRGELEAWGAAQDLLASDTADHYRTFGMLEKLLLTPTKLAEEWTFQLEPAVQRMVIEKCGCGSLLWWSGLCVLVIQFRRGTVQFSPVQGGVIPGQFCFIPGWFQFRQGLFYFSPG